MERTLTVGDIHGNYRGFLQALERSGFDNEVDTLISLGDVVDGHCDSFEVVERLLKIKNLVAIKGNHDDWFNQWIQTGVNPSNWGQGQKATGISYLKAYNPELSWMTVFDTPRSGQAFAITIDPRMIPETHVKFFANQLPYYLDDDNRLFIHGGFNRHYPLNDQLEHLFWWDRDLWSQALSYESMTNGGIMTNKPKFKMVGDFSEVFIGHTQVQFWGETKPMHAANIWNLDTGGGWYGTVTIMDVDSKEFWQSDDAKELYPEFKGRS